jgi:hypothetical protein
MYIEPIFIIFFFIILFAIAAEYEDNGGSFSRGSSSMAIGTYSEDSDDEEVFNMDDLEQDELDDDSDIDFDIDLSDDDIDLDTDIDRLRI